MRPELEYLRAEPVEGHNAQLTSLVAVSTAGPGSAQLRTVDPPDVATTLAAALHGGPPIAPLPTDPIERTRAITMLQPHQPVVEADAAVVVATSGSTGAPKGVVISRAAIRASVEATHTRLGGPGDWVLALPPCYIAGLMVLARACVGGTRAVPVRSDLNDLPAVACDLAERRFISIVPAQLDRALQRGEVTAALAGFSTVLVGGGPTDANLLDRALASGIKVVTTYGMSETCGGCIYDGKPLPGVAVDLSDDGQILIKSSALFAGYRLRPDLTAEVLIDGRFHTRDRGRWDAGRLVVLGRLDDVVITGGHKVDLADVERAVQRWAAQQQAHAAALGIPDPVWGTTILAVSESPGSLEDLQSAVRQWLPAYAVPRELIFLDQLPWLPNGKPDRVAIRSMIVNLRAERQATG